MHRKAVLAMMLDGQFQGKIYILQEDVTEDVIELLREYKEQESKILYDRMVEIDDRSMEDDNIPSPKSILVNGIKHDVAPNTLAYHEIVELAGLPLQDGYTVIHLFGGKGESVVLGRNYKIYPDSKFDVVLTNNA